VVAVRWWGTNIGDIFAFVATLPISLVVSGILLTIALLLWRKQETRRGSGQSQVAV
jgi:hypothetical protein